MHLFSITATLSLILYLAVTHTCAYCDGHNYEDSLFILYYVEKVYKMVYNVQSLF